MLAHVVGAWLRWPFWKSTLAGAVAAGGVGWIMWALLR